MQKHEVLSLLERFPDLVDNDDLLSDLYQQATGDTPSEDWKTSQPLKAAAVEDATDALRGRPR